MPQDVADGDGQVVFKHGFSFYCLNHDFQDEKMGRIEKGMCPYNRKNPSIPLIQIQTFYSYRSASTGLARAARTA
ncbi:hypothetical protein ES703_83815 [subsurface metagenome]